ncbi:putative transcription initiation factor TFIIH subunit 3 [Rosellinia necatrix]|uniref:General transcription and DNA repair factor IIH subunit TFB4 n=1 Tax=Rosellinia necatrix TaxID=77044 RepID=A0A1W2TK87_ROSNE|nr:putative transcription initiation factor TFIIH subunit 3 [Rosellinia necatrix]
MNRIDASEHYDESGFTSQTPSLLTVVIDTNPRAWSAIHGLLPTSKALANILAFINAHLAFGNENQVAILAAHTNRAVWLYPTSPNPDTFPSRRRNGGRSSRDGEMTGRRPREHQLGTSANKYPQFAKIESSILASLRSLIETTDSPDLHSTTLISGALSMALAYIHKTSLAFEPPKTSSDPANPTTAPSTTAAAPNVHARILVLSVSQSAPAQYITTMNAVFAASHAQIPIDTLALYDAPTFLQQAAFITGGVFLSAAANPRGLLSYLMFGFLADVEARASLVTATQDSVDFRAACFCHRNVVDTGFVCSVCLSIFCDAPEGAECLTCGTKLTLGNYGAKPAVVPRRKKKRKRVNGVGGGREETGSAAGTPAPP